MKEECTFIIVARLDGESCMMSPISAPVTILNGARAKEIIAALEKLNYGVVLLPKDMGK